MQSIDQLLPLLDDLCLYGTTELLDDLCRTAYRPVATSSKLIGGSEIDFGRIMFTNLLDQAYQQLQQGQTVDWEVLTAEATQFGLRNDPQIFQEVATNLTEDLQGGAEFDQTFKGDRDLALRQLLLAFCRHMSDQQQMSFVCSQTIWHTILDYCDERKRPKRQLTQPNSYFTLDYKTLDKHVAQLMGGLLSMRQSRGFAVLWGIPYVYEFLLAKQVISAEVCEGAIAAAKTLQSHAIKGFQHTLWRYDFVHRWQCPETVSADDFAAEAEHFAASFDQSEPLSDQPEEPLDSDALMEAAVQNMAKRIESSSPVRPAPKPEATSANTPAKKWKPDKPRKSPLQEAAKLPKKGKKKSKKSGKGSQPEST